ncbi:hypothetical protein [Altererythrobacter sp.]|uniref:hypothetical protein n=1 Tax=Altererythrobacter sp. TaxID=1872480 RepID=UPI003D080CA7
MSATSSHSSQAGHNGDRFVATGKPSNNSSQAVVGAYQPSRDSGFSDEDELMDEAEASDPKPQDNTPSAGRTVSNGSGNFKRPAAQVNGMGIDGPAT